MFYQSSALQLEQLSAMAKQIRISNYWSAYATPVS